MPERKGKIPKTHCTPFPAHGIKKGLMKALVTGASGFIGSTLIEELIQHGVEVFALMRKTSDASNLAGLSFKRVEGDLSDPASLSHAVQGMDYVFHLAGATSAPDREAYFRQNAQGTRNLAEAVAAHQPGLCRFLYVSSLAAAGPSSSQRPRVESEPNHPVSAYGASKLQGETELLAFADRFPLAIVRPPMVYGPKDKGVFVAIQAVSRNLMPVLQGSTPDRHKYYSSVHVRDLCQGIRLVGLAPADRVKSGEIFYVTSNEVHTYRDLLTAAAKALGNRPFSFPVPKFVLAAGAFGANALGKVTGKTYPLNPDKLNELYPDYWVCSNEKVRERLAFKPRYEMMEGMADTVRWYKEQRWI